MSSKEVKGVDMDEDGLEFSMVNEGFEIIRKNI